MFAGATGSNKYDTKLDTFLREFALKVGNPNDWCDKYGTDFENDKFKMHCYCWCLKDNCEYCNGTKPNFHYKPLDFKVYWYKYIGRSVETNKNLTKKQFKQMKKDFKKL